LLKRDDKELFASALASSRKKERLYLRPMETAEGTKDGKERARGRMAGKKLRRAWPRRVDEPGSFSLSSWLGLFRIDGYRCNQVRDDAATRVSRREASRKRLVALTTDYAFLPPPLSSTVEELVSN